MQALKHNSARAENLRIRSQNCDVITFVFEDIRSDAIQEDLQNDEKMKHASIIVN